MKEESIKVYSRRVSEANRSGLIVILYEVILEDLEDARGFLEQENQEEFLASLTHAGKFVRELMASLDTTYPVARDLMRLYIYVSRCLNYEKIQKRGEELGHAQQVLKKLHSAFEEVSRTDRSAPLMEQTQKLFAGLTYGKGELNETIVSENETDRGFFA